MSLELGFRYGTSVLPDALLQFSALKILHNPPFFSFKRVQAHYASSVPNILVTEHPWIKLVRMQRSGIDTIKYHT